MTLSNSIRVSLPTALLSDRISDHDVYRAQPRLALESQALFQQLRGDEGPGSVAIHSKGLARVVVEVTKLRWLKGVSIRVIAESIRDYRSTK